MTRRRDDAQRCAAASRLADDDLRRFIAEDVAYREAGRVVERGRQYAVTPTRDAYALRSVVRSLKEAIGIRLQSTVVHRARRWPRNIAVERPNACKHALRMV